MLFRSRELEQPEPGMKTMVGSNGQELKAMDDGSHAPGSYHNSEGQTGNDAWGVRARWCTISGKKEGEEISVSLIDHPYNVGYPTYWHARGYGLFAANPLGQAVFSKGKEVLNFSLPAKESITFRYRFVIQSGRVVGEKELTDLANQFSKMY